MTSQLYVVTFQRQKNGNKCVGEKKSIEEDTYNLSTSKAKTEGLQVQDWTGLYRRPCFKKGGGGGAGGSGHSRH